MDLPTPAMHDGELPVDEALVARLVTVQLPQFAHLSVRAWRSTGTVNALFRLGDHLVARLPRLQRFAADLERELAWLPQLARRLSLRVPEPAAVGKPTDEFPCVWAVFRWLDGTVYGDDVLADEGAAAPTLAGLVRELAAIDPTGGPPAGRAPLRALDADTRAAIEEANGALDAEAALACWDRARGYAVHQAALIVPYYVDSNPAFAAEAVRIMGEVLGDGG